MISTITNRIRGKDAALFYGLLFWFLCTFVLSLVAYLQGLQYDMPLMVQGSIDGQSYPTLDVSPFEEVKQSWQVGDELRSIDGTNMQGMSTIGAYATLCMHSNDGELLLVLNRNGEEISVQRDAPRWEFQGASLITGLVFGLCGVVTFMGAPISYVTRCFYAGCMAMGINSTFYNGLSVEITYAWVFSYLLASGVIAVYGFKAIAAFPSGGPPKTLWQYSWPWLLGFFLVVPAAGVLLNTPLRAELMAPVRWIMFSFAGGLAIWLTLRNYRKANSDERRQLKWVLLGTYLMFIPLSFATALAVYADEYTSLFRIIDITNLAYPVCWLIAILGYRAFDIDRFFSAVATYTITAAIALALVIFVLPDIAEWLIQRSGLDVQMIYVALSLLVCGALIPLHRFLRPRIEAFFFPERLRLQAKALELSTKLNSCDTEDILIETLSLGLAEIQGVAHDSTTNMRSNTQGGYELTLQPSVGENVYIHLGPKLSGDIFSERDVAVMNRLVDQSETLLLKMRNQALTLQRQAAEQLAAEKSLFLASASHDLRQPMHALGLFSESLLTRNRDERLDVLVQQIHRSTRALDSMFNSILDLSKIDAGAMVPEFGPVYVQLLFEELELEFASAAQQKGLALVFSPSSVVIWSDANLLARVLRNLISNAIRYTDQGKILVGCRYGQDQVRLQVLDTGRGISESDQKRIFTAYARIDKHVEGGLGLGLSLVDKLCKLMDHPLELSSTQGKGSVFSLTAKPSVQSAKHPVDGKNIAWTPKVSFAGLRVLAVDDDPAIRLALTELLNGWGCETSTQDSLAGVAAWLSNQPTAYDLVLVDLHLTERQDGLRILEAVFDQWGFIPALLITGDAQAGSYKWINGVQVAIMNKPLAAEKLRLAMQETLTRSPSLTKPLTPSIQ